MYREFKSLDMPQIDREMAEFWEANKVFEKSVEQRPIDKSFVFYEGPPSANGKPGIHHVMARTVKDLFCRYNTLKGHRVERKGGWDTHGLPIELQVEKELGITKEDIGSKISVDDYNKACRETVMRYKGQWDDITRKMGYWVDLDNPYITFKNEYIESVWALLKKLYDKRTESGDSYLYKGFTVQPYSPKAGTGLSTHELNMPGCYKEVTDLSAIAMFKVKKDNKSAFLFDSDREDVRIMAWTTTPWTLPSNVALTVGPKIIYVKVKTFSPYTGDKVSVILAKDRLHYYFPKEDDALPFKDYKVGDKKIPYNVDMANIQGADLLDVRFEQLIDMPDLMTPELAEKGFRVIPGDWVTTEDGTGVVHTAPYFGADDFTACQEAGIPFIGVPNEKNPDLPHPLVDKQGRFVEEVPEFGGKYVKAEYYDDEVRAEKDFKSTDLLISLKLKMENKAYRVEKYKHDYPHCWRTDKPVLYFPLDSWFVRSSASKDRMVELNNTINWKPESTGKKRFGVWLENLKDWNLSRSRYWGIPLPIWRTEDAEEEICIGSVEQLNAELEKANAAFGLRQEPLKDLHRPYIDDVVLLAPSGKKMKRELDLIDVWFDSGSMPYASPPSVPPMGGDPLSQGELGAFEAWKTANPMFYAKLKEFARENRKNQTSAEAFLWEQLRGKQLKFKARRQHVIGDVIPDFVFLRKLLVIEVDGGYHNDPEQVEYDKARKSYLNALGYKEIRFTNEEVLNDIDGVLKKIKLELAARPTFTKEALAAGEHLHPPFGGNEGGFPADFIAEGVDQTRGWFYTLHAIAVMVYDSVAYKNVVSNGLVLDKKGNKMSKSKGNAVNPFETIAEHGADATRWYMIANASPWDNLKFNTEGIVGTRNKLFIKLYNTYSFFSTYANIDGWEIDEMNVTPLSDRPEIDRWVISKLNSLVAEYRQQMDDYEPTKAARAIEYFVDTQLSNWYVRLCRRRFWKGEMSADKKAAYETLYQCLMVTSQLMSSLAPFFTDWMYKNLTDGVRDKAKANNTPLRHESIHLTDLTSVQAEDIDADLEQRMDYAQRICSLALSIRKKEGLRVRLPLQKIMLPVLDESFITQVDGVKDLILSEINVKDIEYITDASGLISKKAKANFKTLGRKLGKNMKAGAAAIVQMDNAAINALEKAGSITMNFNGIDYEITPEDLIVSTEDLPGWKVATEDFITVALDAHLTPELEAEGLARDLVSRIQNLRKDKDFQVTDRIGVKVENNPALQDAIAKFGDYIKGEVLADSLDMVDNLNGDSVAVGDGLEVGIEVTLN